MTRVPLTVKSSCWARTPSPEWVPTPAYKQADLNGRTAVLHLSPHAGRGRIALAIRVRGSFPKRSRNVFKNARQVAENVVVPKSQNTVVVIDEPFVANHVARVVGVLASIQLNNETTFTADEVDSVGTDRLLPHKFVTVQPARSKLVPENCLCVGGDSSQMPGAFGFDLIGRSHVETPPHPDCFAIRPLPASGERLTPRTLQ
jgi:hypothetical protein